MRKHLLATAAVCAATTLTAAAPAAGATTAPAPAKPRTADFNGDGYPDLAISAHTATVGGVKRAGAIAVAYGSPTGLKRETASIVSQATPGVPGEATEDGQWRNVVAFGDFDGDGYDDLVVRVPSTRPVQMLVLWGSAQGITGETTTLKSEPFGSASTTAPNISNWGTGAGDVNGDGTDDLVFMGHLPNAQGLAGRGVTGLIGPLNRTTGEAAKIFHRSEQLDNMYAYAIAVHDMTGDGRADVVVSGTTAGVRGGMVLKGSATGWVPGSQFKASHFADRPRAFGDLNGDGYADLATGGLDYSEAVRIDYGGPNGLSTTLKTRFISQDTAGVPGSNPGTREDFGQALAISDTNKDGYGDLVVGARFDGGTSAEPTWRSGSVTILRGSATGVTTKDAKAFTQYSAGIPSSNERSDSFGSAVAVLDSDKDGKPELYVGGNGEDGYTGRVWKLLTAPGTGVTGTGATSFGITALGGSTGSANFGRYLFG